MVASAAVGEDAIAAAGQALVDAWDRAQNGPPHRFAVYTDPEGEPDIAAGWMAMARYSAEAIAAAEQRGREAGRAEVLPALTAERDAAVDALSVAIRERDAAVEALATAPELEVALEDGGDTHYEAGFIDAGGEPTGHARDREAADTTLRAAIAKHTNSAVERARAQMAREECVACSGQPESCNAASCITGAVLAGASPEQLHAIATAPRREPPAVAILAELAGKPSP